MKIKHNAVSYPSTNQFRHTVQHLKNMHSFVGVDEEGKAVYDLTKELPTVDLIGTVKIHGTNSSIIMFEDQAVYCQSKERLLSFGSDNAGFWEAMQTVDLVDIFNSVKSTFKSLNGFDAPYPIEVAGEWAGGNIQKGVAVTGLPKFFTVFGVMCGTEWQPVEDYAHIKNHDKRIYNILDFEHYKVSLDLNNPQAIQNAIVDITITIENECPVGKFFGSIGIGEGVVFKPINKLLCGNSGAWFKSKGEKHSSSKVKKLASVDTEKLNSIKEFVEYVTTESRLEQGVAEIGVDIKLMGAYLGWVNKDVFKEEMDTLADNGLEMKDVGKGISDVARKFYLGKVGGVL